MFLRTEQWRNGNYFTPVNFYECDNCKKEICESHPYMKDNGKDYCWECSYIVGVIDGKEYLRHSPLGGMPSIKVGIYEGQIHHWTTKKPPWEASNSEIRRTKQYREWRKKVIDRDGNKCTKCGSENDLQAHHIKPFAKYEKLRFKVSNGLTLCEPCHRAEHRLSETG